jgi:L-lactate dehydrogenase complex protein LldE
MTLPSRPSPKGKRVSLFITCIADLVYPHSGMSVVRLLEHLGIAVDFLLGQTCCGQPAYNGGYQAEAKQVAAGFLDAFKDAEVIVAPSGSCVTMVRHEYPHLFAGDPLQPLAEQVSSRTWEFTEFLVDGLGVTDLGLSLPEPATFAFHDSCHGLRWLGLGGGARALVANLGNASIVEMEDSTECCGFGGLFAIKMADVSGAMLQRKIDRILACPADTIVAGDMSCLAHINGGLSKQDHAPRVRYIADVLAAALPERVR